MSESCGGSATRRSAGLRTFAKVWIALLAMTGIEVLLAYEQVPTTDHADALCWAFRSSRRR